MTKCSKEVVEREMKFYANWDLALIDDGTYLVVEIEGSVPPTSVIKTVVKDKYILEPIGHLMASVGQDNLASARFQLARVPRNIPVPPYEVLEEVYIFETFI
jgi:hypothetical protein